MKHFADFSNSARKAFIRQKQASLLGRYGASESYVDQIQSARRGEASPIISKDYISRSEAFTHPQDNTVFVAAQRKVGKLGEGLNNEHGVQLYRDADNRGKKLVTGNIVQGEGKSVPIGQSLPPKNMPNSYAAATIHTHPATELYTSKVPSYGDLKTDYVIRRINASRYPELAKDRDKELAAMENIIMSTPKTGDRTITSYTQNRNYILSPNLRPFTKDLEKTNQKIKDVGGDYTIHTYPQQS
jgi:hypothetical protein